MASLHQSTTTTAACSSPTSSFAYPPRWQCRILRRKPAARGKSAAVFVPQAASSSSASTPFEGQGGGHNQRRQHQQPNAYGVFQLDADLPCTDLYDVRDACEACSAVKGTAERRQCFEVFGLDATKVDRYYDKVVTMEKMIDQGDSVGQGLVTSGGAVMLYYLAWCILRV